MEDVVGLCLNPHCTTVFCLGCTRNLGGYMDNELLNEEVQESFKLLIHLGLLSLGVAVGLYNVGAFLVRPKQHLAANVLGYSALISWEIVQINKHWRAI